MRAAELKEVKEELEWSRASFDAMYARAWKSDVGLEELEHELRKVKTELQLSETRLAAAAKHLGYDYSFYSPCSDFTYIPPPGLRENRQLPMPTRMPSSSES